MFFYIFTIVLAMILIFLGNFFWFPAEMSLLKISLLTLMLPFLMVAWDGIFATIIRRCLPEKWFTKDVKIHTVRKGEYKFYKLLGIKHWKDHILELGMFTNFSKKHIAEPDSPEYLDRFILESNYGAEIHLWLSILGFIPMLFFPSYIAIRFILWAAIVNAILNILPLMILRYNLYRLTIFSNIQQKKAMRNKAE